MDAIGLSSASTTQEMWELTAGRPSGDLGVSFFASRAARVHGYGYTLLERFAYYIPPVEVARPFGPAPSGFSKENFDY